MYEYEFETGFSREGECEFANEYESDQFLPLLAAAAPSVIGAIGSLFRRRRRRSGQREFEFESPMNEYTSEYSHEYEGEYEGDPFIGNLLQGLGSALGMGEGEFEFESEFESSAASSEYEMLMEHLAYQASQAESEAEAEAFLGALVPLAARLIPSAARAITSVAPSLVRGVAQMGRTLYNSPTTRKLLQTAPTVLKGTVRTLARQVEQGKPISSTTALRALAGNVANVLDNPQKARQALRSSHRAQHRMRAATNGRKRRPALA